MKMTQMILMSGLVGYLMNKKSNMMMLLLTLELMLMALTLKMMLTGKTYDDMSGLVMSLMLMMMTGIESTIGLMLLMNYYSMKGTKKMTM